MRDRSHWNAPNLRPRDPVLLGLCSQGDLNEAVLKARKALEKSGAARPEPAPAEKPKSRLGFDISDFLPE